ncbi:MAG: glyceraldehyde 3-phosphate dehydrogenase [Parcubacteria group bacterium Gr01-1014_72]|nr:MAG: glyceraldehyde 3-phosphate dehydrogenase [Parcubacteria group bacterium Gr01-1014_72]
MGDTVSLSISNGMKKIRVAVNGCGRIGRAFLKVAAQRPEIELVAANDIADFENIVYLLSHDSIYGKSPISVGHGGDGKTLVLGSNAFRYFSEKEPEKLLWKELDVDVVVESTGLFASCEKASVHCRAGAKRVVITAPIKDESVVTNSATILMGLNEDRFAGTTITSNASCTTNAASPLLAILDEAIGIEKAVLNTVHGYTASQALVDGPSKRGFREGRAAAVNIVPSSTGAAIAVTKALPKFENLFDGISIRVPVPAGSIVDVTFIAKRQTTAEEVNAALKKAALEERWKKVFSVTEEELVSSDIVGTPYASIADLTLTRVVGGNLVKVMAWYDNEMGYAYALVEHVIKAGSSL